MDHTISVFSMFGKRSVVVGTSDVSTFIMNMVVGKRITCLIYKRAYDITTAEALHKFLRDTHVGDLCAIIYSKYIFKGDVDALTDGEILMLLEHIRQDA